MAVSTEGAVAETNTTTTTTPKVDLRSVFDAAAEALPDHEKHPAHACVALHKLLHAAPADAHIFDTLGHTFRTSHAAGLPPGVAGVPGKSLILKAYQLYQEKKGPPPARPSEMSEAELAEWKKSVIEDWKDMSEHLQKAVAMLMSRLDSLQ